ncbi:MAG: exo-beta-N-acetylmuramidase NamZ family protein [Microbacter sp.]
MNKIILFIVICFTFMTTAEAQNAQNSQSIVVGAERTNLYLPLLKGKRIAVLTNQTGRIGNENIVDFLHGKKINIITIFSPEHGFRGNADAGEHVGNSIDEQTGIPICSLYGGNVHKSLDSLLQTIDVLAFDLQDVGLRYYTYLTTMVQVMNACATHHVKMIVLDRPNPNGFYVDGPILDMKYKSGVGAVPVPVVHGMTLGELARMINSKKWLSDGQQCDLTVIPCLHYTHAMHYQLPVKPSPNLPNMRSVYLYPSLCYFEATPVSVGRGTDAPFQQFGNPHMTGYSYSFTPRSMPGAMNPPCLNQLCYGVDLRTEPSDQVLFKNGLDLSYLIEAYRNLHMGDAFFNSFFEKLIGVGYVRSMIESGKSAKEIKARWKSDVEKFKIERKPYLLYPER